VSGGAFRFRLERVRALRERTEDQAREELAGAMAEREQWAARLGDAAGQLGAARAAQRDAAAEGVSVADMVAHQAFLERSERAERAAELDLHRQEAEVDARRVALQHAARERQALERLKDKQAAEHRRAAERREGALLDELALSRHRRSRAA
jgi:flagellar protein FliJ